MNATDVLTPAPLRSGDYGAKVAAIEPGGAEAISMQERHGRPSQLAWTWISPNMEFATVFVGVLCVSAFGLGFGQALAAIVLGTGLGAVAQALLSSRGPGLGVPQMILSRVPFGYIGNILPAGLNAALAGVGWFAVNSVSGALALAALTPMPKLLCLLIVVLAEVGIAVLGHNLIQAFERFAVPVLGIIFLITSVIILSKAHPGGAGDTGGTGGFLLALGATFGYAAGWNPYATDYTRYLKVSQGRAAGIWAGLGVLVSCTLLEVVGAASMTIGGKSVANPTEAFTGHLPTVMADLTLLAIALGAVSANAINIYSGTMSFLALGVRLPLTLRRALVAGVFGVAGGLLAWSGLKDAGSKYEDFLLVIAYWIGPWLAVVLVDWVMRRGEDVAPLLFSTRHRPWAGFVAMAVGMVVSIWLFSNQALYTGPVPKAHPGVGDLTFEVGFAIAAVLYAALFTLERRRRPALRAALPAQPARG